MVWQSSASSWYFPRPLWTTRCEFKGLSLSFVSYLLQGSKRVQRNCHSLSLNSYFIVIILCLGQTVYPVAGRECYFFFLSSMSIQQQHFQQQFCWVRFFICWCIGFVFFPRTLIPLTRFENSLEIPINRWNPAWLVFLTCCIEQVCVY